MLPDRVDESTRSSAERQLFNWLAQIDGQDWSFALHSLNLSQHRWKVVSEIDFLLVGRRGLFVLEIKGGRVSCSKGVWEFTDRFGGVHKRRQSPFKQAESAMFSLRDRIEEMLPSGLPRTTFGYGVVFPDIEFSSESVEWDEAMVIDSTQLERPDGLRRSLGRLTSYWRSKPGRPRNELTDSQIEEILGCLRPDFDTVLSLQGLSQNIEREIVRLTQGQYRALDALNRSPRVIFEGGAGTGKTLIAAEGCRRAVEHGASVLYTCRSAFIAMYVQRQEGLEEVVCMPFEMLKQQPAKKFDLLIVDEAQDVVTYDDLSVLDSRLHGGLDDGRWQMFMDSNNQRGLVGQFDDEAFEYLENLRPVHYQLTDNCRNTRQIVMSTEAMTGAELGESRAGNGPDVEVFAVADIPAASRTASKYLERLVESGIDPGDITLLSTVEFRESTYAHLPSRWRFMVDPLDLTSSARPRNRLGFATIANFKGLETLFAIVADIGVSDRHDELRNMYVGMTRARVGLCVIRI